LPFLYSSESRIEWPNSRISAIQKLEAVFNSSFSDSQRIAAEGVPEAFLVRKTLENLQLSAQRYMPARSDVAWYSV
jgi:hypothetical protein